TLALVFVVFFFSSRRRHTRFSRDWSSDVCSSDLLEIVELLREDIVIVLPSHHALARRKKIPVKSLDDLPCITMERSMSPALHDRSEERRVGKECRSRGAADQVKKKQRRSRGWVRL